MTHPGGDGPRPRGAWWREAAVIATAFVICLVGGVVHDDALAPPPATTYLLAVVSCALLPLRHRAPLAALAATTGCGMLAVPLDLMLTPLIVAPAVISAYSLAERRERRTTGAALLVSAALLVASTPVFEDLSWTDTSRLGVVAAFPLVAGVLGHSVRNRRAYLAAVEERARRAEESRDSEARRRVAEERVRIARELHDLVAHQITLANAQATVAAHLFDTRPEQTRKSLAELVATTSDALDDLRSTVGLLRQSGDTATPAEPPPGLSRLPTLLESFRRAGLEVSVHQEGTARPLPPGVDLTAYRIIQEALTNVTKHAGTGSARVRLAWGSDRVTITVADDGRGARTAPTALTGPGSARGPGGSTVPSAFTVSDRSPGYGLIGMRERATAVGGHLFAGRRPEGGFLVSAQLPLPPAKEPPRPADGATTVAGQAADGPTGEGRTGRTGRTGGGEAGDAP
ncbi:signal transduction histidine kinase [Streptomyces aurantiacus]|uniref:sensor histidine kinase n=1 Tax=Streptomyces aurantiacus TaxID=47760 RepID=UPI002791E10A|nr:sensor histidine kinase [Streptomyces aurantiacus]MDQ0778777.1 signal transduction histidine kinase [Streptomyces aurantiacus]